MTSELKPRDETKKKMQPISRDAFHKMLKKAATTIVVEDKPENPAQQLADALQKSLEAVPKRKTRKRKSA